MDLKPARSPDWYESFDELAQQEQEDVHFKVVHEWRGSNIAILAPHGGSIERGTSEIAAAIAGEVHNLYCFECLIPDAPHERFHITSHKFDEPRCLDLVGCCDQVVTVHGLLERTERTLLGGLDIGLKETLRDQLLNAGYETEIIPKGRYSALSPRNICNKGRRGRGIQLELGRDLRILLRNETGALATFAKTVQRALS